MRGNRKMSAHVSRDSTNRGADDCGSFRRAGAPRVRGKTSYAFYEHPDADHCVRKNRGIRTSRWKLIEFWEDPKEWELYDLVADPDETNNLASTRKELRRELKQRTDALRHALGEKDPPGPQAAAAPCAGS